MMGSRCAAQSALFYEFSLEEHVPADHLLRSVDRRRRCDRAVRQAETGAARTMIDRTMDRFGLYPERLIARHRLRHRADARMARRG